MSHLNVPDQTFLKVEQNLVALKVLNTAHKEVITSVEFG